MGFPTDMFPVLFSIPRCAGWLAHWVEMIGDPDLKIFRPRQLYTGKRNLSYVPHEDRADTAKDLHSYSTIHSARRSVSGDSAGGEFGAIPKTVYKEEKDDFVVTSV